MTFIGKYVYLAFKAFNNWILEVFLGVKPMD